MLLLLLVGCSMRSRGLANGFVSLHQRWRSFDSTIASKTPRAVSLPLLLSATKSGDEGLSTGMDSVAIGQERQIDDSERPAKHTVTWLLPLDPQDPAADEPLRQSPAKQPMNSLSFPVVHGETLRTAALRRGVASPHNGRANLINCRGLGTCGTCAVHIVEGTVEPPTRNAVESVRLQLPPHTGDGDSKIRLACQVQVVGDVTIEKRSGFWGQKKDLVAPTMPAKYFGQLEYIMDRKSPPQS